MAGQSRHIDKNAVQDALTQLQQLFGAGKVVPTDVMPEHPLANSALNAAAYLPNQIYGQGIVAPVNDATRNAMNLMQGQQPVPYDQLQSGATKLGYQAGNALNPMQGVPKDLPTAGENAMEGLSPIFHALLIKNILSTAAKGGDLINAYKAAGKAAARPQGWEHMTLEQIREAAHGVPKNYFHDLESLKAAQNLQSYLPK